MAISLAQLQAMAEEFPQGKVYFDDPVKVKKTPHHHLFTAYGIWAHGVNGVWLLDGAGTWHHLEEKDDNAGYVIASMAQRLRLLKYGATSSIPAE